MQLSCIIIDNTNVQLLEKWEDSLEEHIWLFNFAQKQLPLCY